MTAYCRLDIIGNIDLWKFKVFLDSATFTAKMPEDSIYTAANTGVICSYRSRLQQMNVTDTISNTSTV